MRDDHLDLLGDGIAGGVDGRDHNRVYAAILVVPVPGSQQLDGPHPISVDDILWEYIPNFRFELAVFVNHFDVDGLDAAVRIDGGAENPYGDISLFRRYPPYFYCIVGVIRHCDKSTIRA
jgi:hypothetical protein